MVGRAFCARLHRLGHEVMVGARTADAASLDRIEDVAKGSFAEAAAHAELLICAVNGEHVEAALAACDPDDLAGKTLIEVSNLLDPSRGMARAALAGPDNSTAAAVQSRWPRLNVVKTFNTINCDIMVDPAIVPGDHVVFPRSAGVWVEVEDERLLVCRVREILGVIEPGPEPAG